MSTAPRTRDRSRPHDIALWGATGFTGQLVAEHLVRTRSTGDLRLALAGRSRPKLEALRDRLAKIDPAAAELSIVVADSFDRSSLDAMTADAEVVCTTVGPYARYGAKLVESCVEHQTDYCDLTGETTFIRPMIDAHHEAARERGARIVCCCGFDSIPSDIGTLMMQRAMQERHGVPAQQVKLAVVGSRGGASGGTVASMLEMAQAMQRDKAVRVLAADPYGLNPEGERHGPDGRDRMGAFFDPDLDRWTGPFVMAAINTRIVRRSNALLGYPYGRDFRYQEVVGFPRGPRGMLGAWGLAAGMTGFFAAVALPPTRALLTRFVLPSPGEGPDEATRESGYYRMRLFARGAGPDGPVLRGRVAGHKDPGYGATAIMLGEAARCLAVDGPELDSPGGILTPASAMGEALLLRLRDAGLEFEVDD